MPYDIYGNNLRNGFCEVHPYVEQEYPCQICCQEIEREEQRTSFALSKDVLDQLKELADKENRSMANMLEELIKRAALVTLP